MKILLTLIILFAITGLTIQPLTVNAIHVERTAIFQFDEKCSWYHSPTHTGTILFLGVPDINNTILTKTITNFPQKLSHCTAELFYAPFLHTTHVNISQGSNTCNYSISSHQPGDKCPTIDLTKIAANPITINVSLDYWVQDMYGQTYLLKTITTSQVINH